MRQLLWLLVVGVGVAAACDSSTFDSDGGADAKSDVEGIGGGDASTDASTDAAKDGPATVVHFCDGVDASFCSDFDEPDAAGRWLQGIFMYGIWTAEIESSQRTSQPNGFESDSFNEAGSAFIGTTVGLPDAGATVSAVLDMDIFLPALSNPLSPIMMFTFGSITGGASTLFGLAYGGGSWTFSNVQNGPLGGLTNVPTNTWTHLKMTIGLSTSGTVAIDIGNGTATGTANVDTVKNVVPRYPITVNIGASSLGAPAQATVFYDNVVVHTQ